MKKEGRKNKPETKKKPKAVAAPKPKPKAVAAPKPTPKAVAAPKPKPKAVAVPKPKPKAVAAPKPKPKAVAVPKPKPKAVAVPKPKPKAVAAPKPKPEAKTIPKKAGKVQKAVSAVSKRPTSTPAATPSGKAKPSPTSRAAVTVEAVTPPEKSTSAQAAPPAGGSAAIASQTVEPDTAATALKGAKTIKKPKAPRKTPVVEKAEKKVSKKKKPESDDKALVKFDPLQRYLSEISRYKLLTRDQERDLGTRVKEQDDKEAAYVLVTANLRLVVKIALEFQRVWMQNLLDLIQEGNIGLMQAVKKFDPYKNVKFSYYASFWIKAYILKFIMDNWRLVKIGTTQGQRKLFFKLKKEKQHLIEQGFDPKPKLLSERLGVSEREIVDMDQRLDSWDVSLDAPLKNDSETERIEFLSTDSESVEDQVSKKEIEFLLHNKITEFRKKMSPREIEIFELRIFSDNPVTLQEIGDRYGISRERVRQIEKNIIRKMREFLKREIPDFASYSEDTDSEDTDAE
jgi:RNA polymerase sigma-32 factor